MWHLVERTVSDASRMVGHMGREQWIAVFVVALVIGAFMLRGFGARI